MITFFEPTEAFIKWMADTYGATAIIDAGCGYGQLTAALLAGGCPGAMGLDLQDSKIDAALQHYRKEGRHDVICRLTRGDTCTSPLMRMPKAVIVFARPCHDPVWIAQTEAHARKTAETFLYISKPNNAEMDLEGLSRRRLCVGMEIGAEGEELWEFRTCPQDDRVSEDPVRWCLVRTIHGPEWLRDGGNRWNHGWGPQFMSKTDEEVLEDAYVADDNWLDWTKAASWQRWAERVKDTTLDNAWVSPEGEVYRCAYWEHTGLAYKFLRRPQRELEDEGWVKVQRSRSDRSTLFVMGYRPRSGRRHVATKEQVRALLDGGWKLPAYFLEEAEGDWSAEMNKASQREMTELEAGYRD